MEFKGTKGKWVIDELGRVNELETLIVSDEYRICEVKHFESIIDCRYFEPDKEMGKANALLISKAPCMLNMLNNYLSDLRNIVPKSEARDNRIEEVEKLIKEATDI